MKKKVDSIVVSISKWWKVKKAIKDFDLSLMCILKAGMKEDSGLSNKGRLELVYWHCYIMEIRESNIPDHELLVNLWELLEPYNLGDSPHKTMGYAFKRLLFIALDENGLHEILGEAYTMDKGEDK